MLNFSRKKVVTYSLIVAFAYIVWATFPLTGMLGFLVSVGYYFPLAYPFYWLPDPVFFIQPEVGLPVPGLIGRVVTPLVYVGIIELVGRYRSNRTKKQK